MKVRLDSVDVWRPTIHLSVSRLPLIIGRSSDSHLRIDDRWVSRHHCDIQEVDGELVVRDLESRHGTLVNGVHIAQSPLLPGDELTIGIRTLRVSYRRTNVPSELGALSQL